MDCKLNTIVIYTKTNLLIKQVWKETCREILGANYRGEITSGMDGTHDEESGHYHGRALDFKKDMPEDFWEPLRKRAQGKLNKLKKGKYLVLVERTHFHIQRQKNSF